MTDLGRLAHLLATVLSATSSERLNAMALFLTEPAPLAPGSTGTLIGVGP